MTAAPRPGPPPTAPVVTAGQLAALGGGRRRELVDGVVTEVAPAGWGHGLVAATLLGRVFPVVATGRLGRVLAAETGFCLGRDPDTVRAPDLAFVRAGREPADPAGYAELAPDLVAEVVSPSDSATSVTRKALAWLDAGVAVVWVVDPGSGSVTVYRPDALAVLRDGDTLTDPLLPGLALPVRDLWG